MNFIMMFFILMAIIFGDREEITDWDLRFSASASYAQGVDDGLKAMYEYSKENNLFKDSAIYFDSERFMNISDSTVYKSNLK